MTRIMESVEIKAARRQVSQYIWDVNNLPNYLPVSKVEILESGENRTKVRHDFTVAGKTMELVVMGPGNIQQAHTVNEWIAKEQLTRGVDVFSQMVRRFCVEEPE